MKDTLISRFKNRHIIKKQKRIEELKLDITIAELESKLEIIKGNHQEEMNQKGKADVNDIKEAVRWCEKNGVEVPKVLLKRLKENE